MNISFDTFPVLSNNKCNVCWCNEAMVVCKLKYGQASTDYESDVLTNAPRRPDERFVFLVIPMYNIVCYRYEVLLIAKPTAKQELCFVFKRSKD